MKTILITGGTGLIGQKLIADLLNKNYTIHILSQQKNKSSSNTAITYFYWNVLQKEINIHAFKNVDFIIHLAGENIGKKYWTKKQIQLIQNSRVFSTQLLINTIKKHDFSIKKIVCTTAIGWYGADNFNSLQVGFNESNPAATDILGNICFNWENEIHNFKTLKIPLVIGRLGLVISKDGGILPLFLKALKFNIQLIIGNGNQWFSWVEIDDVVKFISVSLENQSMEGIYNVVNPDVLTQKKWVNNIALKYHKLHTLKLYIPA
ncbi:MAG: TIGR01777 family oxidoreductase, partial [Sediminibacterium sp.]|nr:TIGR01777 family oxidoreductase [Sediminibacterium sp.]